MQRGSALGNGVNGNVSALAINDSGCLYVTGLFDTAGGVKANHVASWNGKGWSALGDGIGGTSLAIDDSGRAVSWSMEEVFRWNGNTWDTVGEVGGNSDIFTVAINKSSGIYMGGLLNPGPDHFYCVGMAKSRFSLDVLGSGNWTAMTNPATVSTIAFDNSGNLYAGGYFFSACGVPASCIARWDGNSWSALGSGVLFSGSAFFQTQVSALVVDNSGKLYVSGRFQSAGGKPAAGLAMCNINGTSVRAPHSAGTGQAVRPFFRGGKIHFSLSLSSAVAFRILDISGREKLRGSTMVLAAGSHSVGIASRNLCSGVCFLDFHAGDISYQVKFNVMK